VPASRQRAAHDLPPVQKESLGGDVFVFQRIDPTVGHSGNSFNLYP
jgi:hypothetical protein